MLLVSGLAGCLGPIKGQISTTNNPVSETLTSVTSTVTSQTQEVVDEVQEELAWALSTRELLYAAAVRVFASPEPNAPIKTFRYFGFMEKDGMRLLAYEDSNLRINNTIDLFGEPHGVLAPLVVPFAAANLTEWDERFDDVEAGMPALDDFGEGYSYFLSSFTGTPVWVVTFHGDTHERRIVDFDTGFPATPNPNAPFPSTPTPNVPDFNSSAGRALANTTARAILPDAKLVIIKSEELLAGGVGTVAALQTGLGDMLLPPDYEPSDGKAPGWLYIYVSPSSNQALPVLVYSSGVVWVGKLLVEDWAGHRDLFSTGNLFDSTDAVTVMTPLAKKRLWEYELTWSGNTIRWYMQEPKYAGGDDFDVISVNAKDLSDHGCTGGYC